MYYIVLNELALPCKRSFVFTCTFKQKRLSCRVKSPLIDPDLCTDGCWGRKDPKIAWYTKGLRVSFTRAKGTSQTSEKQTTVCSAPGNHKILTHCLRLANGGNVFIPPDKMSPQLCGIQLLNALQHWSNALNCNWYCKAWLHLADLWNYCMMPSMGCCWANL